MYSYLDDLKTFERTGFAYPTDYDRAVNEYLKLTNQYAQEYGSLRKGKAYAKAWFDELFPNGLSDLTWSQIYWDLRCHREHPPECDCDGINNPNGCAECRVSARVEFNEISHTHILAGTRADE